MNSQISVFSTSFDCYVLGACGSSSGLAGMVWEKIYCSCIGALITSSKTEVISLMLIKKPQITNVFIVLA